MDEQAILSAKSLKLKPNRYLRDENIPQLYQRRAILMELVRPNLVLGDDVGLGKTLETIIPFTYLKAQDPETRMLVFAEQSAMLQWQNEFRWLTKGISTIVINTETHPDANSRVRAFRQHGRDVVITGYGQVYNYSHHMVHGAGKRWVWVADEPNYFKNLQTLLHKNVYGLSVGLPDGRPYRVVTSKDGDGKRMEIIVPFDEALPSRRVGLTATIIENKLEEAFGILRVIAPGTFTSKLEFEKNYCKFHGYGKRRRVVGYKNLPAFRKQIAPAFFGRLDTDPEAAQDLPEVAAKDMPIVLGLEHSKKVLEVMDRIITMPDGEIKLVGKLPSLILAQQIVDYPPLKDFAIVSAKVDALVEALENSLAGQRVVIWTKLRSMVLALEEILKGRKIPCQTITGLKTTSERHEAMVRFTSAGRDHNPVLIGNRAMQKSMNLQAGGHLFLFDLPWSYGIYRQIIGRLRRRNAAHKRIGVYRMLGVLHPQIAAEAGSEETIDHHTLKVVLKKFDLWKGVTGDTQEIVSDTGDVNDIWDSIRNSRKKVA